METKLRIFFPFIIFILFFSCKSSREIITICDNKYNVHKNKSQFSYEENLFIKSKTLLFSKSKYPLFSYLVSGYKENDTINLIHTNIETRNDSVIVTTVYDKSVYKMEHDYVSKRYYKCIPDGLLWLYNDGGSFKITKDLQRKRGSKLSKKKKGSTF